METYFFILGFILKWVCLVFVALGYPGLITALGCLLVFCIFENKLSDKIYMSIASALFAFFLPLGLYAGGYAKTFIESSNERVEVSDSSEIRRFTLVSYSPTKRVYVTLKDVDDNHVYENQYVSTHCSISRDSVGKEFNIRVEFFHYSDAPDTRFVRFVNLPGVFCV